MGLNLVLPIYLREWSGVPGRVKTPILLWGDLPNNSKFKKLLLMTQLI